MKPGRRRFLILAAGATLAAVAGVRISLPRLMRHRGPRPLAPEERAFVAECFAGLDRARVWDTHVHAIGLGTQASGCSVHPDLVDPWHPLDRLRFDLFLSAAGVGRRERADADYIERLLALARDANPEGRLLLYAFDRFVDERGEERPELSMFHTPDRFVLDLARAHREFAPVASIHPYRLDADRRLATAAEAGAVAVKWLPASMGIDPASPRCAPFYARLAALGMPLISHAGREYAVHARGGQDLGNPLRLRNALEAGLRVIVAHAGSLGSYPDLDRAPAERRSTRSFDLFLRLFTDPSWKDRLFADLSSLTQVHHSLDPLRALLAAEELHPRLLWGSDYPLPAFRWLIHVRRLALAGLLDARARRLCARIFESNPILFDFAVLRSLRLSVPSATHRFSDRVFETARIFGV